MENSKVNFSKDKNYSNYFSYYYDRMVRPFVDGVENCDYYDKGSHFIRYHFDDCDFYQVSSPKEGLGQEDKMTILTDETPTIFYENGELMDAGIAGNRIVLYDAGDGHQELSFFRKGTKNPIARFYSVSCEEKSCDWIDVQQSGLQIDKNIAFSLGEDLLQTRIIGAINNGCSEDNFWGLRRFLENIEKQAQSFRNQGGKIVTATTEGKTNGHGWSNNAELAMRLNAGLVQKEKDLDSLIHLVREYAETQGDDEHPLG